MTQPKPLQMILTAEEMAVRKADARFVAAHRAEDCKLCNAGPEIPFSMAFQPIVNVAEQSIFAYEALARGPHGEPAASILDHTLHNNRYSIDQRCREKAIAISASLGILDTPCDLSVNFYPNAVYEPRQCLQRTLNIAQSVNFPLERIIFEVTEVEEVRDKEHLRRIMSEYKDHGLRVAIDDFGAGHAGLGLLSEFQPDIIKLDRELITRIDERPAKFSILKAILQMCNDLRIQVIAEGVEREEEMNTLCRLGIQHMQGFFFARPEFEKLPLWG